MSRSKKIVYLSTFLIIGAVLAACTPGKDPYRSTGSYPIDIFPEMHYNQTYKAQEPPRLSPPSHSVPVTGKEVPVPALKSDAVSLINPTTSTAYDIENAAKVYHVNCSMCHGMAAGGDGFVGQKFAQYNMTAPPAFNSERVQNLESGEIYWSLTQGFGFMPAFGNLLTPEERWHLVHLVQATESKREALLKETSK